MKNLHVIPSISPIRGGPSQAILEIVTALHTLNIEAEIVTTNDNGDGLLDVPLGTKTEYQQIPVYQLAMVQYYELRSGSYSCYFFLSFDSSNVDRQT